MNKKAELKKLGLLGSMAIYVPAAILLYCQSNYLIPFISRTTGQETILFWFIVAGLGVFTPLIIAGILILNTEGYGISKSTWSERLRFRKITKKHIL
jgi:hypothetical protein